MGKDGFPDALVTSLESMRKELSDANDLHTSLQSELNELRSRSFSSLNRLAFDLTDTLQENQKLSTLLSLLERHAKEQHCDLQHYYHVKEQQSTIQTAVPNMSTNQHDQAAIASLVKNLIDADHERLQAERRSKQKSDKLLQSDVATIKHSAKAEMRPSETFLVDKKFVYKNKIATDTTQSNRTFHQTAYDMPILQNSKGTSSLRISKAV